MKKSSTISIPLPLRIILPLCIMRLPPIMVLLLIMLAGSEALAGDGPRPAGDSVLRAGTAKVNITPATDEPIHDSIYARNLVLEGDGVRIAFVAVDLAVFTSARIEKVCREKYGIRQVMLCSSHNHSEPQPQGKRSFQTGNPYTAFYEDRIIEAIGEAVRTLFPARIAAGRKTFPQLGFNRLIVREDGHARESWFSDDHYTSENPERIPFGPVDPEVGVIRIDDAQGQPRAILMNYACHADIVCFNYAVSADYPGVACRKVEEAFGNRVTCLFVQGAGGNVESLQISSRRKGPDDPFQTDYAPMVRTGELLAFQAIKLVKSLSPSTGDQDIRFMEDSLHFTGRFDKKLDYTVHLSTLLINKNIAIAVCPGELFAQLGLDWKKQMELAEVQPFLFGYTWSEGSWPGYIADVRSAALGGYGADQGGNLIEPGAGEAMMTRQLADFYRLNGLMRDTPGPVGFKAGSQWVIKPFISPSAK
jgi:neutral ceramidase